MRDLDSVRKQSKFVWSNSCRTFSFVIFSLCLSLPFVVFLLFIPNFLMQSLSSALPSSTPSTSSLLDKSNLRKEGRAPIQLSQRKNEKARKNSCVECKTLFILRFSSILLLFLSGFAFFFSFLEFFCFFLCLPFFPFLLLSLALFLLSLLLSRSLRPSTSFLPHSVSLFPFLPCFLFSLVSFILIFFVFFLFFHFAFPLLSLFSFLSFLSLSRLPFSLFSFSISFLSQFFFVDFLVFFSSSSLHHHNVFFELISCAACLFCFLEFLLLLFLSIALLLVISLFLLVPLSSGFLPFFLTSSPPSSDRLLPFTGISMSRCDPSSQCHFPHCAWSIGFLHYYCATQMNLPVYPAPLLYSNKLSIVDSTCWFMDCWMVYYSGRWCFCFISYSCSWFDIIQTTCLLRVDASESSGLISCKALLILRCSPPSPPPVGLTSTSLTFLSLYLGVSLHHLSHLRRSVSMWSHPPAPFCDPLSAVLVFASSTQYRWLFVCAPPFFIFFSVSERRRKQEPGWGSRVEAQEENEEKTSKRTRRNNKNKRARRRRRTQQASKKEAYREAEKRRPSSLLCSFFTLVPCRHPQLYTGLSSFSISFSYLCVHVSFLTC